jgi:hypothetical protein
MNFGSLDKKEIIFKPMYFIIYGVVSIDLNKIDSDLRLIIIICESALRISAFYSK